MATSANLEPTDREFFTVVVQIAFCNPFSEHRLELDAKILGHPVGKSPEEHLDEFTTVITSRVQKLEAQGLADLRQYSGADRDLLQTVFLFETYHQCCRDFDQLILDQVELATTSVR